MIRDLEIPLICKTDQFKVAGIRTAVDLVRDQSELLIDQARAVQNAILDAVRYNIPLDSADFVGGSRHDGHDQEKENK